MSFTFDTIVLCLRWYPINSGVLFLLALDIIFFADLILSEIGFSNKTGILFFKKLTVCFSCNWLGVATITASNFFVSFINEKNNSNSVI